MKKFEYFSKSVDLDKLHDELNAFADQGWEIVNVFPSCLTEGWQVGTVVVIAKRRLVVPR